jgi:hypothetical protein
MADLALVAQRQVTAMHSAASGLPHLLAPAGFIPGASGGATNLFGWVATGLVEEARALAAPTLLLTGQLDFPSHRTQASPQPSP